MSKKSEKKHFQVYLPLDKWDKLKEYADSEGRSMSDVVRQMISDFFKERVN